MILNLNLLLIIVLVTTQQKASAFHLLSFKLCCQFSGVLLRFGFGFPQIVHLVLQSFGVDSFSNLKPKKYLLVYHKLLYHTYHTYRLFTII